MAEGKRAQLKVFEPMERLAEDGFLYRRWRGRIYPPFIDPDICEALTEQWDTDPGDIFISSHQKVGTHLTKKFVVEILRMLIGYPEWHGLASGDIGHGTIAWPEVTASQHGMDYFMSRLARTDGLPRAWYLHWHAEQPILRRIHPQSRFIFVLRDPKGAAVSQYFFYKSHPLLGVPADLDMERFLDMFLEGGLYFGDYQRHALGWMHGCGGRIAPESLLVLRYEDLVERKAEAADAIAAHILPGSRLTDEQRTRITEATEFGTMKKGIIEQPGSFHFNPETFFRSGTTDDWRRHLSPSQAAAIDAKSERIWGSGRTACPDLSGVHTI
jgi:hypothetical protein